MTEMFGAVFGAMFVNNILLTRYLGNCPFCGVSKNMASAWGMGMAVLFVLTIASAVIWIVHHYLLVPFNLTYLQTIVFILIIATNYRDYLSEEQVQRIVASMATPCKRSAILTVTAN